MGVLIKNTNFGIVISALSYSKPFGGRKMAGACSGGYTFGFNGQYKDDEVYGEGNAYAFEYRIHDARIGRFLSVDPLAPEYPWNSTYSFCENRPIDGIELEGLERLPSTFLSPGHLHRIKLANELTVWVDTKIHRSNEDAQILLRHKLEYTGQLTALDFVSAYSNAYLRQFGSFTDLNDVAIFINGTNFDGSRAANVDYVFASAGIFIPFVNAKTLKSVGTLVDGFVKGFKNGESVVFPARKIENYGHKGTKEYNSVLKGILSSKGETFVTQTKDEALMFLKEAFPGIIDETNKKAGKFGYRVDDASETTEGFIKNGHDGKHINYYNKETGVKGTITWTEQ